jgi:regulator of protease activity HflC (stomatin/prohibitin superfamily)
MMQFKRTRIRSHEKGLLFVNREFTSVLEPGEYWLVDPLGRKRIEVVSQRAPWIEHAELDVMVRSGRLGSLATVVDLADHQRALVWIDGRFERILSPGLYAYWNGFKDVRVEAIEAATPRFAHKDLSRIMTHPNAKTALREFIVEEGHLGLVLQDGELSETLNPGKYAFWNDVADVKCLTVDTREKTLDVAGQDILTADKVTLRLNAVISYRVADAAKSLKAVEQPEQALYREAQLALRAAVGVHTLEELLEKKSVLADELEEALRAKAEALGLKLSGMGVRDVILPGEMKALLNKVTEAKKAAEANLIMRREETAAMRSQANTAKLLENNPTLMRLKELETLATIAESSKLNVILGEKGLTERVVNLL